MKKLVLVSFVAAVLSTWSEAAQIPLCENSENILAERLAGTWVKDDDLEQRLGAPDEPGFGLIELKYAEQKDATKYFPARWLSEKCAYTAGFMDLTYMKNGQIRQMRSPYIVVSLNGNPAILFDEKGDSDGTDDVRDLHIGYMMFAKAQDPQSDILFVGGDNNNQRLYAVKRK